MSAKTLFHRPMQRIILNGDFHAIHRFVLGLERLQWQVTVVQMSIETMPSTPVMGYAQKLRSELILAL
ncbi:MAG: hypothetical protein Q9N32_06105 [Gammaproteobacteria bacterium]|nr:hypothetical protein [Gammaproteobacteria bacterium]